MPSRDLEQCLIVSDPARLKAVAEFWGLEGLPTRRREAAAALMERMLAPGGVERAWESLSPEEREALAALREAGGEMPWPTFSRRWGEVRAMGPGRMARERPWQAPISPTEALWYRGLLFRMPAQGPAGLYEVALLPEEILARLPELPAPSRISMRPTDVPSHLLPASDHLLDDACTLLAYLQTHSVRAGADGEWPAHHLTGLARQLRDPDPGRMAFLRHLADRLGWLRVGHDGCLRPDPGPAAAWLRASTGEQRAALARAWRDDPAWNDLWHVPTLRPEKTGSWRNDPLLARRAILRHLSACRPGEWYSLAELVAAIQEADPDFQRPDGDYAAWYIRDAATGEYLSGFASWEAVEGALIRYLLTGPLAWLGLVDLGTGMEGGPPVAFRLTPAGAAFLGMEGPQPEPEQGLPSLTVRPDLTVLAPAVRRYERFQLSRIADWVRTGDPYIYRLTAGSLERARQQRISPERVVAFLEEVTERGVSPSLRNALSRWARHGSQVRIERGVLLRVGDEALMGEVLRNPAVRRLVRERLGPTAALVAPADWPRLVEVLVEQGLLPGLEGVEE